MPDKRQILSRDEVLELLSKKASEGSVTAMVCLERALRLDDPEPELDDELKRLLARD